MDLLQRRRSLMQAVGGGGDGYITNGLIFRLDGIDKGTTDTTKWVDLVGGIVFTEANSNACHGSNHIIIGGSNFLLGSSDITAPPASTTLECAVYRPKMQGWGGVLVINKTNAGILSNNSYAWCNSNYCRFTSQYRSTAQNYTVGFAGTSAIENGQIMATTNGGWDSGAPAYPMVGCLRNSGDYKLNGNIFAIRVYSRLLTTDEMLHNQKVDNERFNLGLTLPDSI